MILLGLVIGLVWNMQAQEKLSPFYGVTTTGGVNDLVQEISKKLEASGFELIGTYDVANNDQMQVLCFTSDELQKITSSYSDRGALAAVFKIGVRKAEGNVELSLLNPNYMFYAYFGEDYKLQASALGELDKQAKEILSSYGKLISFGGELELDDLKEYHYKVMMPYFSDPIELEEYDSFQAGLSYIKEQIAQSGADINLVYELVIPEKQMAVFGIGLADAEKGEAGFLPIIGERHIAAMPYEIILQNKEATMLHGKFRFALYWPELTMSEFMKIMSAPGDVEDAMESITEK